jgi:phospholipid/cholesterol/gamma-HCH transport system permease protein
MIAALGRPSVAFAEHLTGLWRMYRTALYWTFVAPFRVRADFRAQGGRSVLYRNTVPLMDAIGIRSVGIVFLVAALIGAILVLQTADILKQYGQIRQVPGLVAISMTRELGPLMTAIVLTARVGAAYTAGLGTMKISDEILALQTMAINPVGFLVAPRLLAALIMTPCLVIWSNLIGMVGGFVVAYTSYDIGLHAFIDTSLRMIEMRDLVTGMVKAVVFGGIIGLVPCYFGFIVTGGPEGVGRNTMVSVVTTLVAVIFANFVFTGILTLYF